MQEALSFLLSVAPAGYLWWVGRRLLRRIDDPAFPELRFARGQRLSIVIAVSIVSSLVLSLDYALLKIGLTVLSLLVANYPARREIFGESWSLLTYLSFMLRFWLAVLGVWLLIAWMPLVIRWAGDWAVVVSVLLVGLAILWGHFNAEAFAWISGAGPLNEPGLETRFEEILARSDCTGTETLRLDTRGGFLVNAFALPAVRRPAVLFSADLLAALTADETAAIFAHEVGHLEYFDRRRLLRRNLVIWGLFAGLLAATVWLGVGSSAFVTLTWVWPLAVLVLLAVWVAGSQGREHDSDVRAVELTGDPDALISGLTKIHELMRMPRRWRESSEGRFSHPSLARRVRAIREAAGAGETDDGAKVLSEVIILRGAGDPSELVMLAGDRLHWLQGLDDDVDLEPRAVLQSAHDCRSIRYSELADLRLEVRGMGGRYLKAVDRRGSTLRLAIRQEDVGPVKDALERIDLQVRDTAPGVAAKAVAESTNRRNSRVLATLAGLSALLPPISLPLAVAAALALIRPSRATLAAVGTIGIAAGLLALRGLDDRSVMPALLEVAVGCTLLYATVHRYRRALDEPVASWKLPVVVLGGLALLYLAGGAALLGSPLPVMQLHLWARYHPGLAVVLLGIAGVLVGFRQRIAYWPAATAVALAGLFVVLGTLWFRDAFAEDPLAMPRRSAQVTSAQLQSVREIRVAGQVHDLRLAPSGAKIAAFFVEKQRSGFQVELADGGFATIQATDLAFLDDERVAVLRYKENGALGLQVLGLGAEPVAEYEIEIEPVTDPVLRVDPLTGRWEVAGALLYEGRATLLSGAIGSDSYRRNDWSFAVPDDAYLTTFETNFGGPALAVTTWLEYGSLTGVLLGLNPLAQYSLPGAIWAVGASNQTRLATTTSRFYCVEPLAGQLSFTCVSTHRGSATAVWSVDAVSQRLHFVASVPGEYYDGRLGLGGELLLNGYFGPPALVELSSGTAWILDLPVLESASELKSPESSESDWLSDLLLGGSQPGFYYQAVASAGDMVALATAGVESSEIRVYRIIK